MGKLVNFVGRLHKSTKRNYLERMVNQNVYCMKKGINWSLSVWDMDSLNSPVITRGENAWPFIKIPSAPPKTKSGSLNL